MKPLVVSIVITGVLGGALYWYFFKRGASPTLPAAQDNTDATDATTTDINNLPPPTPIPVSVKNMILNSSVTPKGTAAFIRNGIV